MAGWAPLRASRSVGGLSVLVHPDNRGPGGGDDGPQHFGVVIGEIAGATIISG